MHCPELPQIGMMLHMQPTHGEPLPDFFANRAAMVTELEACGVQAVWVTEHHFDAQSLSAVPLMLLAHWAAVTRRIQLGVAAVLPAGRNPTLLAEEIALLSNLAPGRIAIGFAKGGSFESQKRAFGWGSDAARADMRSVVDAVLDRLRQHPQAAHEGTEALGAALQPPLHGLPPLFVASREPDTLAWAAQRGLGWMTAQFWPMDVYDAQAINWSVASPHEADALLARGLWIADDGEAARQHALAWLTEFRRSKQAQWKVGFRGPLAEMDESESLARMIIGTPAQCAEQLDALLTQRRVPRLAFNPMHDQPAAQVGQMRRLLHEVLPLLCAQVLPQAARRSA